MASVSAYTAPLLAEYSTRFSSPAHATIEHVLTIAAASWQVPGHARPRLPQTA
jgi:hypothetical protein